jgi:hypothetical protein
MALSSDTTYEEFLQWFDGSAKQGQMEAYYSHRPETMNALSENSPGYERNEAGRYVNESGEELFYYTGPDYDTEYRNGAGLNADAGYMTMADIEAKYNDDDVLQRTFGSVDQYKSYISDRQNLIDQGVIMDKWERSNQLWHDTFMRTIDGRGGPNGQYMADILETERRRVEEAELAANQQLAEQYGIESTITDTNGNTLMWNGSGYSLQERYKEDDNWGRTIAGAGAGLIVGGALAPMLGGLTGAAPAGLVGPASASQVLGGKLAAGLAAGAGSAASQGLLTGSIDPRSVLSSAIIGGVDPGGMLGDNLGLVPDNVVGGFVRGSTNNVIGDAIATGDVDLKDALISGAIGAGANALTDLLSDSSQFSTEAEMERIRQERITQGLPPLTTDELYQEALLGSMTGRSDLGGLVGEDGLLSFIPTVPTGGLNNLLGGGYFDPNAVFIGPDGKEYTDLEVLEEGLSPADIYSGGVEGWTHTVSSTAGSAINTIENGFLDALAEQEFKDKYGMTPTEALEAGYSAQDILRVISYGPLDETYNWAENPRGISQYVGLLTGLANGGYTQGSVNDGRVYEQGDGGISDSLDITGMQDDASAVDSSSGGSNVITNLGDTGLDPDAVLSGSNNSLVDGFLQGALDGAAGSDGAATGSGDDLATGAGDDLATGAGEDLATGPGDLTTGSGDLTTGSGDLTTGSGDDLTTGSGDLTTGSGDLVTGSGDLTTGSGDLTTGSGDDLVTGTGDDLVTGTGTDDTLSSGEGGSSGEGLLGLLGGSGLPPVWGELYAYKPIKGYRSKRSELVDSMLSSLMGQSSANNLVSMPKTPLEKELFEAGMLS